jgi:hypothetical protein
MTKRNIAIAGIVLILVIAAGIIVRFGGGDVIAQGRSNGVRRQTEVARPAVREVQLAQSVGRNDALREFVSADAVAEEAEVLACVL